MNVHQVIRRPVVTEKSNIGREEETNVVTFAVEPAGEQARHPARGRELFERDASSRCARCGSRARPAAWAASSGKKPEWKKAIVTLAEGQTIEFFEGV